MSICRSLSLAPALAQPGASRASCMLLIPPPLCSAAQLLRELPIALTQPLGRAEDIVLRHVRRVFARGRMTAQCLRERADVMRPRAAAHAEILDAQRVSRLAELPDLVPIAREGIERHRERTILGYAVALLVVQRLEGRLLRRGPVGHRQRRHMTADRAPNSLEERQHGAGTARAIEP